MKVAGVIVSRHAERSEASTHVRRFFAALRMTSRGHFRPSKREAPIGWGRVPAGFEPRLAPAYAEGFGPKSNDEC